MGTRKLPHRVNGSAKQSQVSIMSSLFSAVSTMPSYHFSRTCCKSQSRWCTAHACAHPPWRGLRCAC